MADVLCDGQDIGRAADTDTGEQNKVIIHIYIYIYSVW